MFASILQTLPIEYGGMGQTPTTVTAPLAALSALTASRRDPLLAKLMHHLKSDFTTTYDLLLELLGVKHISPTHPLARLIPTDVHSAFCNGPITNTDTKINAKVQACAVPLIMYQHRAALRQTCAKAITDNVFPHDLSLEDATHILAVTSRSQNSRIFTANLFFQQNHVPRNLFIAYTRYHFNLPQYTHGRTIQHQDCTVRPCDLAHGSTEVICPTGKHAFGCKSTFGARTIAHNTVRDTIVYFAQEQHYLAKSEPPTTKVLLDEFTLDETHILFPKNNTAANNAIRKEFNACKHLLKHNNNLTIEEARALQANIDRLAQLRKPDAQCITLDALIQNPTDQETLWVDVARIHPTVKSRIDDAAQWFAKEAEAERLAMSLGTPNPFKGQPSKPVQDYAEFKYQHYAYMCAIADKQQRTGARKSNPTLLAGIISHTGEFSKDIFTLANTFAKRAKAIATENPSLDGISAARVSAEVRTRFKDAIATCNVLGVANALLSAGIPKSGQVRSNRVDPDDVPY